MLRGILNCFCSCSWLGCADFQNVLLQIQGNKIKAKGAEKVTWDLHVLVEEEGGEATALALGVVHWCSRRRSSAALQTVLGLPPCLLCPGMGVIQCLSSLRELFGRKPVVLVRHQHGMGRTTDWCCHEASASWEEAVCLQTLETGKAPALKKEEKASCLSFDEIREWW